MDHKKLVQDFQKHIKTYKSKPGTFIKTDKDARQIAEHLESLAGKRKGKELVHLWLLFQLSAVDLFLIHPYAENLWFKLALGDGPEGEAFYTASLEYQNLDENLNLI
jgi:hypothetical protein